MLFDYLKSETEQLHKLTEDAAYNNRLGRDTITHAEYAQLLRANLTIVAPLEATLAQFAALPHPFYTSYCDRMRSTQLQHDLSDMDVGHEITEYTLPAIATLPSAVGAMYVLEGSALGGLYIVKQLRSQLELADLRHRFYTGRGRESGPLWRVLSQSADALVVRDDYPEALAGARVAFRHYIDCYQEML